MSMLSSNKACGHTMQCHIYSEIYSVASFGAELQHAACSWELEKMARNEKIEALDCKIS